MVPPSMESRNGHSDDLPATPVYPIHNARKMRVICVGAGLSGLCFAYKLQRSFEDFTLQIFERNEGISGVWFNNRYPGVECDFPIHNYTYTFEPYPDFPCVYANGREIREYFLRFSEKYGLDKFCYTNHEVKCAAWSEEANEWCVQVDNRLTGSYFDARCDIFVNATGVLSQPRWPEIKGIESFKGQLVHSGRWDECIQPSGKRVAIIGNGSSGQQLVRALQPLASGVVHLVRQPTWTIGTFGEAQREYTPSEISKFRNDPSALLECRKQFENVANSYFGNFLKDSPGQNVMRSLITEKMKIALQSTDLADKMIPKYGIGCRRVTPGVGYLEALTAPNVNTVFGEVAGITANGIEDSDGKQYVVDIIICATGFHTSYIPSFKLIGKNGVNLSQAWATETKAYLATTVPEMPNYFMFYGPNNPFASGSYIAAAECQADYMLKMCNKWQTENIRYFAPRETAVEEFLAHTKKVVARTVWADDCRSWYKKGTSDPAKLSLWPGSVLHFMEALSEVRYEDYDVAYHGNRFSWLGTGFSQVETDETLDRSYYIRAHDDGPLLGLSKNLRANFKQTLTSPQQRTDS